MSLASITYRGFGGARQTGQYSFDVIVRRGFAAFTGLPQLPPIGYQYTTDTLTPDTVVGQSLAAGSFPAVVIGDVYIDTVIFTPGNYTNLVNGDGTLDIFAGGDGSRQRGNYGIYRKAGNSLDPTGFPTNFGSIWVNEVGPVWNGVPFFASGLQLGLLMIPVNMNSFPYASSPEGDSLNFTLATGTVPPGLSISPSGVISGTPITLGVYNFTVNAADITGTATASPNIQIVVGNSGLAAVPNVTGMTLLNAIAAMQSAGFSLLSIVPVFNLNVPFNSIIAQNPNAGTVENIALQQTLYYSIGPSVVQERFN